MDALVARVDALQRQLDAVQAELTDSHKLTTLGTLAAIVAHEINNLLTPIISYAQMAQAEPDDANLRQKAIDRALDGAQRAARISSSVLGFAGASDPEPAADLRSCVEEALSCLARDPKRDGITLHVELIDADLAMPAGELLQVLVNLLLNARKAMGKQGGRLSITAKRVRGHCEQAVQIDVADSGPGIPAGVQDRLFEPFVTERIHDKGGSPWNERRGTGLGLAICRQLVEKAGGAIRFTTRPGVGTTFSLVLPTGRRAAPAVEAAQPQNQ